MDAQTANLLIAASLLLGTPFFLVFGSLSDRDRAQADHHGGLLLAALTYFPIFRAITHYANPALEAAQRTAPGDGDRRPRDCSVQFNPVGTSKFTSACDVAKAALVRRGVPYAQQRTPVSAPLGASVRVGATAIPSYDATAPDASTTGAGVRRGARRRAHARRAIRPRPTPERDQQADGDRCCCSILVIYVTMVYAPIAAMLVEMFPTRIRYTSMSLPYHIGNGWFGGFLPTIAFAIVAATGNIYSGLWYPIVIAVITLVIGMLFVKETKDVDIRSDTLANET